MRCLHCDARPAAGAWFCPHCFRTLPGGPRRGAARGFVGSLVAVGGLALGIGLGALFSAGSLAGRGPARDAASAASPGSDWVPEEDEAPPAARPAGGDLSVEEMPRPEERRRPAEKGMRHRPGRRERPDRGGSVPPPE